MDISADVYEWVKALHLLAVISWMAGLLYLPRLFIYHCDAEPGSDKSETFKVMERRLFRAIMGPARAVALLMGIVMAWELSPEIWSESWFLIKIASLVFLMGIHDMMGKWRKDFEQDRNTKSSRFFRFVNEVPTVLMIIIVIMVVVRPFS